jgi:hypothetical protein
MKSILFSEFDRIGRGKELSDEFTEENNTPWHVKSLDTWSCSGPARTAMASTLDPRKPA